MFYVPTILVQGGVWSGILRNLPRDPASLTVLVLLGVSLVAIAAAHRGRR